MKSELVLRAMMAYQRYNPAPQDMMAVPLRLASTPAARKRHEKMAAYIAHQVEIASYTSPESALPVRTSHNSGERLPNSNAAGGRADTA